MRVECFLVEPVWLERQHGWTNAWDDRLIDHWVNPGTGETRTHPSQFGVGVMWQVYYFPKNMEWENETEPHVIVVTPGGSWDIGSRASNCTMKEDKKHRCWIRHGDPPNLTVDKNGMICQAGAGSILFGPPDPWHGFLTNGILSENR